MSQQRAVYQLEPPKTRFGFRPCPKRPVTVKNNFRLKVNETQKHLYASGAGTFTSTQACVFPDGRLGCREYDTEENRQPILSAQERERYLKTLVQRAFSEYLAQQESIVAQIGYSLYGLNERAFYAFRLLSERSATNFRLGYYLVRVSNSAAGAGFRELREKFATCKSELAYLQYRIDTPQLPVDTTQLYQQIARIMDRISRIANIVEDTAPTQ